MSVAHIQRQTLSIQQNGWRAYSITDKLP